MRVLVIADPHIAIPPREYGGTERIVHLLCRGLAERGHTVDLIAAYGSNGYGGHVYSYVAPEPNWLSRASTKIKFQCLSLCAARRADVVITHGRPDYLWALYRTRVPIIVQFHNPIEQSEIEWILSHRRDDIRFVGVSQDQVSQLWPADKVDVVYNGVPLELFPFRPTARVPRYAITIGRLTRAKGIDIAIAASKKAGIDLVIAGNLPREERGAVEYFHTCIEPHLSDRVRWIGPVGDAEKASLLGGASALLFPVQWREPFGIVMAEALAAGCPVIGWRNGAVPEVICHGVTGFVVESLNAMVDAIRMVDVIDRGACRSEAESRFSGGILVDNYMRVFGKLGF